ncbi:hypothetical protein RM780_25045 [Streptomyces sp. DSM 44917]|uniref:DUF3817 domain-containing protein n=1 Tax=Streptomyces boetiae TaxID=3075541 RepID=A0ABU2LF48_9ACTN|nr:hypothetical protein [Streptomyces sp. DSM 44917]MDT0310194.1 hypothetical protein [Streptomyces sp. DSM 44917]
MNAVGAPRALRAAAAAEAVSLAVLLANLLTVHAGWVSSLTGPVHGTAYLATIALAWPAAAGPSAAAVRLRAFVPGVGGLLALRRLEGRSAAGARGSGESGG